MQAEISFVQFFSVALYSSLFVNGHSLCSACFCTMQVRMCRAVIGRCSWSVEL